MFSDTFRNSESKDTLFSSRSDYRLHGTSTVFLFSPPSEEGVEKERDFFRGKKIGSVDVAAAAAVLNSPSWKGRKKERKKEGKSRKERGREESRGRNSKRKTVRHSIIKRENEYGNCGVLSRRHDDSFQRNSWKTNGCFAFTSSLILGVTFAHRASVLRCRVPCVNRV